MAQYPIVLPELVRAAKALALRVGFELRPEGNLAGQMGAGPSACIDEVGALLTTLTTAKPGGLIGEVGTGAGVGTAWLADGLRGGARLVSVEVEPELANVARKLFAGRDDVEIVTGDWLAVMPTLAPFDLLFFDGGGRDALEPDNWPVIGGLLRPGGMLLLDDLTPEELWPDSWRGKPDAKRELAFRSGWFVSAEIRTRANSAVLLLVKQSSDFTLTESRWVSES